MTENSPDWNKSFFEENELSATPCSLKNNTDILLICSNKTSLKYETKLFDKHLKCITVTNRRSMSIFIELKAFMKL